VSNVRDYQASLRVKLADLLAPLLSRERSEAFSPHGVEQVWSFGLHNATDKIVKARAVRLFFSLIVIFLFYYLSHPKIIKFEKESSQYLQCHPSKYTRL
jgi:hypothetical protein